MSCSASRGFLKGEEGQCGAWANPLLPEYPHVASFVFGDLSLVCTTPEDTNAHELGKAAKASSARGEQGSAVSRSQTYAWLTPSSLSFCLAAVRV